LRINVIYSKLELDSKFAIRDGVKERMERDGVGARTRKGLAESLPD